MKLSHPSADIFVPDASLTPESALGRTTHLCVLAHQDDIEINAYPAVAECFGHPDRFLTGVVLAQTMSGPLGGLFGEFLGWRGVFWVLCGLTLAVALWIFLSVPDKPRAAGPSPTFGGYVASSARILASPIFWCFGPAVATISIFNFAYLGLWAGPWLRDVAGMDGSARAFVLFLYTLAMIAGSVLTGSIAARAERAGLPPVIVPVVALVGVVAVLMTAVNPLGRKGARTDDDFRNLLFAAVQQLDR